MIAKLVSSKYIRIVYKKDVENFRWVSLTSFPWKVMEQIILETISKPMKDKMTGSGHWLGGGILLDGSDKLCEIILPLGEGRAGDVV